VYSSENEILLLNFGGKEMTAKKWLSVVMIFVFCFCALAQDETAASRNLLKLTKSPD